MFFVTFIVLWAGNALAVLKCKPSSNEMPGVIILSHLGMRCGNVPQQNSDFIHYRPMKLGKKKHGKILENRWTSTESCWPQNVIGNLEVSIAYPGMSCGTVPVTSCNCQKHPMNPGIQEPGKFNHSEAEVDVALKKTTQDSGWFPPAMIWYHKGWIYVVNRSILETHCNPKYIQVWDNNNLFCAASTSDLKKHRRWMNDFWTMFSGLDPNFLLTLARKIWNLWKTPEVT